MNKELEEGYVAYAEIHRRDAEFFLPAQAEVVLADVNLGEIFNGY